MRIHLRSTTCWETSASRFRDGLVGKEVRDHKGIKAIVEISVLVASSCSIVQQSNSVSPGAVGAPAVAEVLGSHASGQHSATIVKCCDVRSSARWMDCRDEEHELRALTSRAGHERACMRIVE